MPLLYDDNGKPIQVADSQTAQEGLLSGKLKPKATQAINVVDDGKVVSVQPKDLQQAFASGMRIASDDEGKQAYLQNKYQKEGVVAGTLHQLSAYQAGLSRGAGFGVTDKILTEVADIFGGKQSKESVQNRLKELKEVYPLTSAVGEVAGTLAGALIPVGGEAKAAAGATKIVKGAGVATEGARALREVLGGAEAVKGLAGGEHVAQVAKAIEPTLGLSAEAAEAAKFAQFRASQATEAKQYKSLIPSGLADLAGGYTEEKLVHGLGYNTATNAIQKMGIKGIAGAVRGAVEGTAMGAGEAISEDALGDHELTTERLLSHMGHGALLGAAFGGVGGTAIEGISNALSKASPTLRKAADMMTIRSLEPKGKLARSLKKTIDDIGEPKFAQYMRDMGLPASKIDSEATRVALEKAGADLEGVGQKYYQQADNVASWGKEQNLGIINDMYHELKHGYTNAEGEKTLGLLSSPNANKGAIRDLVNNMVDALGVDMRENIHVGTGKSGEIYTKKFGNIVDDLLYKGENDLAFTKLMDAVKRGNYKLDTAQEAAQRVREIQQKAKVFNSFTPSYAGGAPLASDANALRGLSVKIRNQLDNHVSSALGEDAVLGLKEWRQKYRVFRRIDELAENAQLRGQRNNLLGLSDSIVGAAGLAGSIATGNPLSAVIAPIASKWMRDNGTVYAAKILDKAANIGALKSIAAKSEATLDKSASSFFKAKPKAKFKTYGSKEDINTKFDTEAKRLSYIAQNPDIASAQIMKNVEPIMGYAPNSAAYMQKAALGTALYLHNIMPKGQKDTVLFDNSTTPNATSISDFDKAKWLRQVQAAYNPYQTVAHGMQTGTLTPEQVQTIKKTNPKAYNDIAGKFATELALKVSKGDVMPYQKKIQLGTLFNIPADHSMQNNFVLAAQANFAPPSQTSGAAGRRRAKRGAGAGISEIASGMETESIRRERGGRKNR